MSDTENTVAAPHVDGRLEDATPADFSTNTTLPPPGEAGYLGAKYYDKVPEDEKEAALNSGLDPEIALQVLSFYGVQETGSIELTVDQTTGVSHISVLNDQNEVVAHDSVDNMIVRVKGSLIANIDVKQKVLLAFGGDQIVFDADAPVEAEAEMTAFVQVRKEDGTVLAQNTLKALSDEADGILAAQSITAAAEAQNPEAVAAAAAVQADPVVQVEEAAPAVEAPAVAKDPENG